MATTDNPAEPIPAVPLDYTVCYSTMHQGPCSTATFNYDGSYDTTVKVLDVAKMNLRSNHIEDKPMIQALYDQSDRVNDLAFHPNGMVLATCSADRQIKLYDMMRPKVKWSIQHFQDSHPVLAISFHPSGDFLAAAAQSAPSIRLFDVKTFQGYTASRNPDDQHTSGGIRQVRFADNGSHMVTAGDDDAIKVWDIVSGSCVKTLEKAHGGNGVSTAQFSRNGKYILSSGRDSSAKLWETTSGKLVHTFKGAAHTKFHVPAAFNYNESLVFSIDEDRHHVCYWDSKTGAFVGQWAGKC
ncbi:hypothetical protein IWQ60_005727 [Tieghemiomyces parasiticus]|uniref:Cleavage stimulation factor 50 kDa subunit n=1 Tax=Tieghemiomyces parasiticus TaxID=78921 RepID=A0A9W8DST4_9FUNG|nr:hypothetical protein IWQ60_005727 [Tieghemiomyces parasiticus]